MGFILSVFTLAQFSLVVGFVSLNPSHSEFDQFLIYIESVILKVERLPNPVSVVSKK